MTQDANDLLMNGGGGPKSAGFTNMFDVVRGIIADDPKVTQCRKYDEKTKTYTSELEFWPSGDPMWQINVTIQTDLRDPEDENDTGLRTLHITPRMQAAVREAVKNAGAKGLAVGGEIAVQWSSGTGQGKGNARQYTAAYRPPQVPVGAPDLLAAPAPSPTAYVPAPPGQVALVPQIPPGQPLVPPAVVPASAASLFTAPAQAGPPAGSGIDPALWAALPDEQRRAVLAAMPAGPGF